MTATGGWAHADLVIGFDRLLSCASDFEPAVSFVCDVLGLKLVGEGIARTDPHFARYARVVLPSGATLAVVEPTLEFSRLVGRQVVCLRVRDIRAARTMLEQRAAVFATDLIDGEDGLARMYVPAPDGNVYQFYGPIDGRRIVGTGGFAEASDQAGSVLAESSENTDPAAITGLDWVLTCANEFEPAVAFVRNVLGFAIAERGVARIDTWFNRYNCAPMPGGGTLEIVEPSRSAAHLNGRQIACLKVDSILAACAALDQRGAVFASDLIDDGEGLAWIYVHAPDGNLYQVYGPKRAPGEVA